MTNKAWQAGWTRTAKHNEKEERFTSSGYNMPSNQGETEKWKRYSNAYTVTVIFTVNFQGLYYEAPIINLMEVWLLCDEINKELHPEQIIKSCFYDQKFNSFTIIVTKTT